MKATEIKAKELVRKFYVSKISTNKFRKEESIQCAIICVEEIIKTFDSTTPCAKEFWQEVLTILKEM